MIPYRVVRLLKNKLYPTYQLHAYMAGKKTAPMDGLRLAALTTIQWLRFRLGEHAPAAILNAPEPETYRQQPNGCLQSVYLNAGFTINIVSLPEQGIWSLQITEPDLGSDPGNSAQARPPVPGRIIETNIAYKVVGQQLECGFQTILSDPEGTDTPAEVYRLAIIRQLATHPDFGLKQLTLLDGTVVRISTAEQLKTLLSVAGSAENALPCVVFTQVRSGGADEAGAELPSLLRPAPMKPLQTGTDLLRLGIKLPLNEGAPPAQQTPVDPPYALTAFAGSCLTFGRVYLLEDGLTARLCAQTKQTLAPGDTLVMEPQCFGGAMWTLPFKKSKSRQNETIEQLKQTLQNYPRGKQVDFGHIAFLSAAREGLLHNASAAMRKTEDVNAQWAQRLASMESEWKTLLSRKEEEITLLTEQVERQRQYQTRIEGEKDELRQQCEQEVLRWRSAADSRQEEIAYLRRALQRPKEHSEIVGWVERHFADRIYLHSKAVTLLEDKSARSISLELICDALDFLATDYWDCRYRRISKDEMHRRCSEKYGRPFEIKPTGATAIATYPAQYKIKYFPGARGKPVETPLDCHLCVGNDPENLLRIYFLHDDAKQLIVIGSLPRHLKAVTIR